MFYIITIILLVVVLLTFAIVLNTGNSTHKKLDKVSAENIGDGQYGSADFLSEQEFINEFLLVKNSKRDKRGVIVGYSSKGDFIIDNSDKNMQIIGPPGTGKSKSFYEPNLAYNLDVHKKTNDGYNIFTIDLKGDQTDKFANIYKDAGYNVSVIDFRNVSNSDGYNPLSRITKLIEIANKYPKYSEKYINYYSKAEKYANILAQTIIAGIEKSTSSAASDYFITSSTGLVVSLILLASEYGKSNSQQSLVSVFELLYDTCEIKLDDNDIQKSKLDDILNKLPKDNRIKYYAITALAADVKTTLNVLSSALAKLLSFMDMESELILVNDNEILSNLEEYVSKPVIIFLILPDEDDTKDFFGALIVRQLYTDLIEVAHSKYNGVLPRQWLCLEDEAGNFPAVKKKDRIMTAVRSRNVKIISAYQNDHQIKNIYGESTADVIEAGYQTILTASLSPKDSKSKKKMSERLGKKTILSASTNMGKSKKELDLIGSNSSSTTYNMIGRDLLTLDEITKLDIGEWILEKVNIPNPIRTRLKLVDDNWNIKSDKYKNDSCIEFKKIYRLDFNILENFLKEKYEVDNIHYAEDSEDYIDME